MNHPAVLFRRLSSLWRFDSGHPHLEALAADLAASLAEEPAQRCIGLVAPESARQLRGLADLLTDYGFALDFRYRQRRDAIFVFADRTHPVTSLPRQDRYGARRQVRRAARMSGWSSGAVGGYGSNPGG